MPLIRIFVFVLISVGLTCVSGAQNSELENPLDDFMARLSNPRLSVPPLKLSGHGGPRGKYEGFHRRQGDFGLTGILGESERRLIWNPQYFAVIEKLNQQEVWMLQSIQPSNTSTYKMLVENENLAGAFFGPLEKRFEFLEFVRVTEQADGLLYQYRYSPDSPVYSTDPTLNSMSILFDKNSDKVRLLEIRHQEGGGGVIISATTTFDYPEDAFFPLKRIGKAVVAGGEMGGSVILKEEIVEIDLNRTFDSSECYLSHYNLPEPPFASSGTGFFRWVIWIVGFVLLIVFIIFIFRYVAGKTG